MSPVTTLLSCIKRTRSQSECSCSRIDSSANVDGIEKPKKIRQTSGVENPLKDVIETRMKAEEAAEERHQENMATQGRYHQETTVFRKRFLTAFVKMADVLQKKNKHVF
ncbi:uncharacterized protein LOC107266468 [Cephus cinctus]|uniref:Uncharacterized protein LOC107266468 n=1 Tax=Cephus cinctus TaxID=211228 RepID=A0AAJ7W047_CEPCN|nr:uncharacterized protein LOC107266468 [Cephus cinctus]